MRALETAISTFDLYILIADVSMCHALGAKAGLNFKKKDKSKDEQKAHSKPGRAWPRQRRTTIGTPTLLHT